MSAPIELFQLIERLERDAAYLRGSVAPSDQDVAADIDEAVEALRVSASVAGSSADRKETERSRDE